MSAGAPRWWNTRCPKCGWSPPLRYQDPTGAMVGHLASECLGRPMDAEGHLVLESERPPAGGVTRG